MKKKVYIVDEDSNYLHALVTSLEKNNCTVSIYRDGLKALDDILLHTPDLLILEVNLPDLNGFSLCSKLRESGFINPIIFLSYLASEKDIVLGINAGANDYIRKPPLINELLARVNLQLGTKYKKKVEIKNLEVDLAKRKVFIKGQEKKLSHKETKLLYLFTQHPNKIFSREELLSNIWGDTLNPKTRTVDIHMGYLRKKIEDDPKRPQLLQTIRGLGYTLNY